MQAEGLRHDPWLLACHQGYNVWNETGEVQDVHIYYCIDPGNEARAGRSNEFGREICWTGPAPVIPAGTETTRDFVMQIIRVVSRLAEKLCILRHEAMSKRVKVLYRERVQ